MNNLKEIVMQYIQENKNNPTNLKNGAIIGLGFGLFLSLIGVDNSWIGSALTGALAASLTKK